MPTPTHCKHRRDEFLKLIDSPVLLFAGGWIPRNYPANWSPFRADSNFLLFFPDPEADSAALFDPSDKSVTLFLNERTAQDALWHGPVPSFEDLEALLINPSNPSPFTPTLILCCIQRRKSPSGFARV